MNYFEEESNHSSTEYYDVEQSRESSLTSKVYRSWWKFLFWVCTICIGSFYIGFTNTYAFILMTQQIPDNDKFWFLSQVGFYCLFAVLGAFSTNQLCKVFSRRNSLSFAAGIGIIGTILVWFSYYDTQPTNIVLIIGRIIQGVAGGMFSVLCPIIIKQIVPTQLSVTFGCLHQFSIIIGLLTLTSFTLLISKKQSQPVQHMASFIQQLPLAFPIPLLFIKMLLLKFIYKQQTPKYLIEVQRKQQAKNIMKTLYKNEFYMQIYIDLQHAVSVLDNPVYQGYNMTKIRRKIIYLGIYVAIMQQISGISIVNTYGLYPYEQKLQKSNDYWLVVWSGVQLIATSILVVINVFSQSCPNFMRKFTKQLGQRKILFFIGNLLSVVTLLLSVIVTHIKWENNDDYFFSLAVVISLFVFQYGLTLGPITWIYLSEILQLKQMSFAAAANWFTALITISLLPMLPSNNQGKIQNALIVLLCVCTIFSFFNYKYIVQTKNKTPIQIVRTLSNTGLKNVLLCGFCQKEQEIY